VELKTLPLNQNGKPRESTYVCTVALTDNQDLQWASSLVKRKLSRVLWVPVEADPGIPLPARRVGTAVLWSPDNEQETVLRQDWEELMEMVTMGELEQITAHHGRYLQIRPKAANAKVLRAGIDNKGDKIMTLPRGFYLRAIFTRQIIQHDITGIQ
ncbi:MAG: DNA mismatch repair protein MutH, partial [Gammaproteobacteria bacterium]